VGSNPEVYSRDKKWEETLTRTGKGTRLCGEARQKESGKKWEESKRPVSRNGTERGIRFWEDTKEEKILPQRFAGRRGKETRTVAIAVWAKFLLESAEAHRLPENRRH
jgi:hypothetical protein